jgi:hypothetical protein
MALEKTKLVVEIETKATGSGQKIQKVTAEIEGLGDQAEKTSRKSTKAIREIEEKYSHLLRMAETSGGIAININQEDMEKASKNLDSLSDSMKDTINQSNEFSKAMAMADESVSGFEKASQGAATIATTFIQVQSSLEEFVSILEKLTDPRVLARIQTLLKVLSVVARLKGFKSVSDQLADASDQVTAFASNFNKSLTDVQREFDDVVRKADLASAALEGMSTSVDVLKVGALGAVLFKVGQRFEATNKVIKTATSGFKVFSGEAATLGEALTKKSIPGLLGAADKAGLLSAGLLALGGALKNTENEATKMTGTILFAAGILAGGFTFAVFTAFKAVSQLAIGIGDTLISSMTEFEQKAAKAEEATNSFAFTIRSFGREMGTGMIGTLERWNKVVEETADKSTASTADIQKSIKLLVADASVLGITFQQNQKIFKTAADIAAVQGKSILEVTTSIIGALNGQGVALRNMGVDLSESGIAHSKYGHDVAANIDTMDDAAKAQLRYNVLLEKSVPFLGAAEAATETITGATQKYEGALDSIAVKLGESGVLTRSLIVTMTQLLEGFLKLPDVVFTVIGVTQDFLGVTLKVVGTVLQYIFLLGTLVSGYKLLVGIVSTNSLAQAILTKALSLTAAAAGVQVGAVTGLSSALAAMATITKGVLLGGLASLKAVLLGLIPIIKGVTVAVLTNPLLWAAVAIVSGIVLLSKAVQELSSDMKKNIAVLKDSSTAMQENAKETSMLAELWQDITNAVSGTGRILLEFSKLLLTGVVVAILKTAKAFLFLGKHMSSAEEDVEKFDKAMQRANIAIMEAQDLGASYAINMLSAFDETAIAAERQAEKIHKIKQGLDAIAESAKLVDEQSLRLQVLGDNFDQGIEKAAIALNEFNRIQDQVRNGTEKIEDAQEKLVSAREKAGRAFLELTRAQRDIIKSLTEQSKLSQQQILRDSGQIVEAVRMENKARTIAFETQVAGLVKLREMTGESLRGIKQARKSLLELNKALLDKAAIEERTKLLEKQKRVFESQATAMENILRLQLRSNKISLEMDETLAGQLERIDLQTKLALHRLDAQRQQLVFAKALTKEMDEQLKRLKKLIMEQSKAAKADITPITLGGIIKDIPVFMKSLSKGFENANKMFGGTLGQTASNFGKLLLKGGKELKEFILDIDLGKLTKGIGDGLFAAGQGILAMFDPDNIQKVADFFGDFLQELPNTLMTVLENLDQILGKFIDSFPEMFENLLAQLPGILQSILDKLPALIETIIDAVVNLIDALPNMISRIIAKLPEILQKVLDGIPEIIDALFEALPLIISDIIRAIPDLFVQIVEAIPFIVERFVAGLVGAVGEIAEVFVDEFIAKGGIVKIVVAFVKMVPKIWMAILKGLVEGLKRAAKAIFSGATIPAPALDTKKLEKSLKESVNKIGKQAQKAGEQLFSVVDIEDVKRRSGLGGDISIEDFQGAIDDGVERLTALWVQFLDAHKRAWMWVWENVLEPIANLVRDAWLWVWENVLEPIVDIVKTAWMWVWENILEPLADIVKSAWMWVKEKIIDPLANIVKTAWMWVVEKVLEPIAGFVKDAWMWVKTNILDKIGEKVQEGWKWVKTNIIDKLAGLFTDNPVSKAFNKLAEVLDKIIEPFKKLADALGNFKMPSLGGGGGGGGGGEILKKVADPVGIFGASGGMIPGYVSGGLLGSAKGTNDGVDNQIIAAQSGEFMIRRAAVQSVGAGNLAQINQSGQLPAGNSTQVTISEGAIVVQGADSSKEDIAEEILDRIKRGSMDGEFIISIDGLRST